MDLRRIAAVLVVASLSALGCYSPNIADGTYACGADGGCPDKFHCASNHLCYQKPDASFDMSLACNSVTNVQPIVSAFCSKAAASAQCNPICQTGCNNCGWCAVAGGAATCLTGTAGKKTVGATCDPSKNSDCSPGLYCQSETCGTVTTGTCYLLCDPSDTTNSVCGAKSACNVAAKKNGGGTLPFSLCSPICDPLSQTNTNCAAPFGCYPSGPTTTECDCAGSAGPGDQCFLADTCAPGQTCVGPSNATTCRPICTTVVGCTSGTCTIPNGAASGTCM
jgi:hypothetical protein